MNAVLFYIAYAFIWLITWLPLRVLFVFSDLFFILIYHIAGYRRKIVRENLRNSFPEKPATELRRIEKAFYHHLCDSFVEWVYPLHHSARRMEKYYYFKNPELFNQLYAEGRGVVGVLGHYGNWEYLSLLPQKIRHKVWAIYKPLNNPHFDRLIYRLRSKFGVHMVSDNESIRKLISETRAGEITMTYFLADQSPQKSKIRHWVTFLNQPTPVFLGAEQIAKKLDMAVVFIDIIREKQRGHYSVEFRLLAKNPREYPDFEITEMHVRALENRIRKAPEYWLWSHRRWKHKPPAA